MSHNAPHPSIKKLANEILGLNSWGQSERVAFALEKNWTLQKVDAKLKKHFNKRELTDDQRDALRDAPFMK